MSTREERKKRSKRPYADMAKESAKGHIADGMSLEAAMEAALSELELPPETDPRDEPWMDTPYPTGRDPRYDRHNRDHPETLRKPGERTAIPPQGRKY